MCGRRFGVMKDPSSSPRPKDWLENPQLFGRSTRATVRDTEDDDVSLVRTALLQHHYCLRIRRRLDDDGMTLKQLSDQAGIEYQYLTKLLRGDLTLQLHHLAAIENALPGVVFSQTS
ncbi:hypothetical protein CKW39_14735 [Kocuria sp. WRN011]|nr:hypothetical protein CKW39_14735 [Kocuria sp. WRN011]